jgi:hypothetical protein
MPAVSVCCKKALRAEPEFPPHEPLAAYACDLSAKCRKNLLGKTLPHFLLMVRRGQQVKLF